MADDSSTKPTVSLCDRLYALPQELFDEIYEFTFTLPAGKEIRTDWRVFPSVLRVNRAHRRELSEVYYRSNTFLYSSLKEAVNWYELLGVRQRGMMRFKKYSGHRGHYTWLSGKSPTYQFLLTIENLRIMTLKERSDEEAKLVKWPTPRESQLGRNGPSRECSLAVGKGHARMTKETWRQDLQTQSATQFPALQKADRKKTTKSTGVTSLAIRFDKLGCS